MLHKEIPFLRLGLPLCLGIISGLWVRPELISVLAYLIIVISGFCLSLFFNVRLSNIAYGISLNLALFGCGLFLYNQEKAKLSTLEQELSTFICELSEYPEEKENSYMLTVRLRQKAGDPSGRKLTGSMVIYNRKRDTYPDILPGDLLEITCVPRPITNRGNPNEFDYRFYMENNGIKYYAFTDENDVVLNSPPNRRRLIHHAQIIRQGIIDIYRKLGIGGEELAVVAAITLGQKNLLDQDQKENFIRAGVVHIMAVSGLHAMILSLFIFNLLFFLKGKYNTLRVIITIIVLWAFAFVTGLAPSVQRASLMFTFLHAGKLMKRPVNNINSVLASAFVLILIRPSVIYGAGFLLSYSAVIFIICFYNDLYPKLHPSNRLFEFLWKSAVVTLVAQAGTLPLTITLFNRFPALFLLSNIMIVPLASVVIVAGSFTLLASPIPYIPKVLAFILAKVTWLTGIITEKVSLIPFSSIENIGMTTIECFFLFCFIFLSLWFLLKKEPIALYVPLMALLLYAAAGTAKNISLATTNELVVYNSAGSITTGIRSGRTLNIVTDSADDNNEVLRHSSVMGIKIKSNKLVDNKCCTEIAGKRILICNYLYNNLLEQTTPDIIILAGTFPRIERGINFKKSPEALIISSQASAGYTLPHYFPSHLIDTIHYVRTDGAFRKILTPHRIKEADIPAFPQGGRRLEDVVRLTPPSRPSPRGEGDWKVW